MERVTQRNVNKQHRKIHSNNLQRIYEQILLNYTYISYKVLAVIPPVLNDKDVFLRT
jgi:hypothetical protein